MELLRASSYQDFLKALATLETSVPFEMRKRGDRPEVFCAARLLATLPESRLSFPLALDHRDRPDFQLTMHGSEIGLEHTEAIPQNVAHAQAMRDEGLGPDTYFEPYAELGEPKKSRKQLQKEIEEDDAGDGWVGDGSPMWAEVIRHFVGEKVAAAKKPGFSRFVTNWLVIYDSWPNPGVNVGKAMLLLAPQLMADQTFDTFDAVFVMRGENLVEFTRSSTTATHIRASRDHA